MPQMLGPGQHDRGSSVPGTIEELPAQRRGPTTSAVVGVDQAHPGSRPQRSPGDTWPLTPGRQSGSGRGEIPDK
ncbi:hypothetical protein E4P39_05250 [Blastococcus sp. CT_GayMR19]|nr:hypothetical protein E4P39_05250 [Blastococcus sp. CT_GayMR19]